MVGLADGRGCARRGSRRIVASHASKSGIDRTRWCCPRKWLTETFLQNATSDAEKAYPLGRQAQKTPITRPFLGEIV